MVWLTLVVAILGLLFSGAALGVGLTRLGELVRYVPRSIGTLKPRQRVRLRGTLTYPGDGLSLCPSPITATPCCWWQVQIFRGGGKQSRLLQNRQSRDPLYLRDDTGKILLWVVDAEAEIQGHQLHGDNNGLWPLGTGGQFDDRRTVDYMAEFAPGFPTTLTNLSIVERGLLPGATLWVWGIVEYRPPHRQVRVHRLSDSLHQSVAAALVIPLVSLAMVRICGDVVLWASQILVRGSS